jgi:hypothetical protein
MLMFSMPIYEVKYEGDDGWQEISELELMDELYRSYKKVTPAIKEMIQGNEIKTPHGVYRLKLKGGENANDPSTMLQPNYDHPARDPSG